MTKVRPPRIFKDKKKRLYIISNGIKRILRKPKSMTHDKLYMLMIQKLITKAFPKRRKRKRDKEEKDVVFSRNISQENNPTQGGTSINANPFQSAQDVINAKNAPSSTQQTQQLIIKDARAKKENERLLLEKENKMINPMIEDIPTKQVSPIKQRQLRNARIAKLTPTFTNKINLEKRKMLKKLYPNLYSAKDKKANDSIIEELEVLLAKGKIEVPTVPSNMDLDELNALTDELQQDEDQQQMAEQLERNKPTAQRMEFDEAVQNGQDPEAIAKAQEQEPTQEENAPEVVDDNAGAEENKNNEVEVDLYGDDEAPAPRIWTQKDKTIAFILQKKPNLDKTMEQLTELDFKQLYRLYTNKSRGKINQGELQSFKDIVDRYFEDNEENLRNQYGGEKIKRKNPEGMSTDEIEEILKDTTTHFCPVIPHDCMDSLLKYVNPSTKKFGFVMNTENHNENGQHWRACFIENSDKDASIEYYDSLSSHPDKTFMKGIANLVYKMRPDHLMKLKWNKHPMQSDFSKHCGEFCVYFISGRYNGYHYDDLIKFNPITGEKMIKKFMKEFIYV